MDSGEDIGTPAEKLTEVTSNPTRTITCFLQSYITIRNIIKICSDPALTNAKIYGMAPLFFALKCHSHWHENNLVQKTTYYK